MGLFQADLQKNMYKSTTIMYICSRFVQMHKKNFITAGTACKQGRAQYYATLQKAKQGKLVRVKRGVYAKEIALADTMVDVEALIPGGILCMFSAWEHYGLTTQVPQQYDIAIKRGRKIVVPQYPNFKLHNLSDNALNLGVTTETISGYKVKIFDLEKCICDAVKFRNKIGIDVCTEIIKNYLKRPDRNIAKLMKYAKILRVAKILEMYLAMGV
jgi:predicted transcriptional regulator of viral defense system